MHRVKLADHLPSTQIKHKSTNNSQRLKKEYPRNNPKAPPTSTTKEGTEYFFLLRGKFRGWALKCAKSPYYKVYDYLNTRINIFFIYCNLSARVSKREHTNIIVVFYIFQWLKIVLKIVLSIIVKMFIKNFNIWSFIWNFIYFYFYFLFIVCEADLEILMWSVS